MHIMRAEGTPLVTGLTKFIDTLPEGLVMAEIGCYAGEATFRFLKKRRKFIASTRGKTTAGASQS